MSKDAIERLFQNRAIKGPYPVWPTEAERRSSAKQQVHDAELAFAYFHINQDLLYSSASREMYTANPRDPVWCGADFARPGGDKTARISGRHDGRIVIVDEIEFDEGATKKS